MRPAEFYAEHSIDLRLATHVAAIDPATRTVALEEDSRISYGALLLATGAEPIRLDVPGASLPHVRVLRTLADCDALIARAATAQRCVVAGDSFIALEVAASLRKRGLQVHVVAPETRPMERIMGAALVMSVNGARCDVLIVGWSATVLKAGPVGPPPSAAFGLDRSGGPAGLADIALTVGFDRRSGWVRCRAMLSCPA